MPLLGDRFGLLLSRRRDLRRRLGDGDVFLQLGRRGLGLGQFLLPASPRLVFGRFGRNLGLLGIRLLDLGFAIRGQAFLFLELDVAIRAGHVALAFCPVPVATTVAVPVPVAVPI